MTEDQVNQYHEKVDANIQTFGYHVTFVFAKEHPSFCYSTGIFKTFGIPEIFISALPQNLSHSLVEAYVNKFRDSLFVQVNTKIDDLTDRFSVYLIDAPVEELTEYVLSSIRFYQGKPYKYVQLIYPDTAGNFPGEPGYDYDQAIIGEFNL